MGMNNSGHNCMCNYLWDINVKTVNRLLPYSTSCVPATIDSYEKQTKCPVKVFRSLKEISLLRHQHYYNDKQRVKLSIDVITASSVPLLWLSSYEEKRQMSNQKTGQQRMDAPVSQKN